VVGSPAHATRGAIDPVVTQTAPAETVNRAADHPCRASFRPDTIASDLIWLENLRLAFADVLAVQVTGKLLRPAKL
jgi:hypothetical protein